MSIVIDTPGLYRDMPAADYHRDPCLLPSLSSSVAVDLIERSPVHAYQHHPRLGRSEEVAATDEMNFGGVVHEMALGRGGGFAVWSGDTWRGKEAASFWDSAVAAGKTPIKLADFDRASTVTERLRAQLTAMGLSYVLDEGDSEVVAVWQEGKTWMRAMLDKWIPKRGEIWDIKTTGKSAHPDHIARTVAQMRYDLRSEFYLMGMEKLTGVPTRKGGLGYQFLFIETSPPFLVTPCYLSATFRSYGRKHAAEAIAKWAHCMESGVWPGYTDTVAEIQAPGWIDFEIEEAGIAPSGERIV